jgi:peptide subunit release factor 1 (eRF1)
MKITKLIEKLGSMEPDGKPFFSIYINAEAGQNGRDTYPIWLKTELSDEEQKYKDDEAELGRFTALTERINNFVENEADPSANGIAIFASLGEGDYFEVVQLDVPFPESRFHSSDRPHIFPLARAVHENPRYAVLWADKNKADIYVFGGETRIRSDVDAQSKVESIENEVTSGTSAGGWSQQRFQRRRENFALQHAKEVVAELEEVMKKYSVEHLIIAGDEETILPVIKPELSKPLEDKLIGSVSIADYQSEDDIREKTLDVVTTEMATLQMKEVERVNDATKAAAKLGTLGVEDTLRALANGQVEELVIASNIDSIDYSKKKIKKILKEYEPGDDTAPTDATVNVSDAAEIADQLVMRAINTAAKIMFVKDDSLLEDAGGVGSILRFNMNAQAGG